MNGQGALSAREQEMLRSLHQAVAKIFHLSRFIRVHRCPSVAKIISP